MRGKPCRARACRRRLTGGRPRLGGTPPEPLNGDRQRRTDTLPAQAMNQHISPNTHCPPLCCCNHGSGSPCCSWWCVLQRQGSSLCSARWIANPDDLIAGTSACPAPQAMSHAPTWQHSKACPTGAGTCWRRMRRGDAQARPVPPREAMWAPPPTEGLSCGGAANGVAGQSPG